MEKEKPVQFESFEPAHTETELREHLQEVLGEPIKTVERLNLGQVNAVYRLTDNSDERYFIKVSPKARAYHRLEIESWAYQQCRSIGVPTPEVVNLDISETVFPEPYLLTRELPGEPGGSLALSAEERLGYTHQLGEIMSHIHTIRVDGFGKLIPEGDGFRGRHGSLWEDVHYRAFESNNVQKLAGTQYQTQLDWLQNMLIKHQALFDQPKQASLIHYDLSTSLRNILAKDGKIVGVVDMENSFASDPVEDFAYAHFWDGSSETLRALQERYTNKELFNKQFMSKLSLYALTLALSLIPYFQNREEVLGRSESKLPYIDQRIRELQQSFQLSIQG